MKRAFLSFPCGLAIPVLEELVKELWQEQLQLGLGL